MSTSDARKKLIDQIRLELAYGIVNVELDPEHYEHIVDVSLDKYRQKSSNSVEESYGFLELQPNQSDYVLPKEVIEVRQLFRRGIGGSSTGGGTHIDPFAMAYTNMYLLQSGRQGGLATYDFFHQYQELVGRMFGRDINFKYNSNNNTLTIVRQVRAPETVVMWLYNYKPDDVLINDIYAKPWIRDWAVCEAKMILGHAYSKFSNIVGPQGGTTLNGEALKAEATAMMEKLEMEFQNYGEGSEPLTFVIG
ncbi:MAG: hypothetical protein WC284_14740 [Candidimonas sp.]